MTTVQTRADVDVEYTWDLESIFASDDEWESAYADASERVETLASYEGRCTADASTLLETLETRDRVMRDVSTIAAYARMRRDEDTTDDHYQALTARASSLATEASAAASFVEPEVQELTRDQFESMVDAEPALGTYDHYVDDVLRMKPHTRSAEVEQLLAELGEVTGGTGEVYTLLSNADMTFPMVRDADGESVEITQSNLTSLLKRPDRAFREQVYRGYFEEWATVRHTVAAAHKHSVKADVKLAQARGYDTARQAALDGPNVPVEVYDTLVETVRDELGKLHRHLELKREGLGVDNLRMWDIYVPMTGDEGPTVEYDDATDFVVDALEPLGGNYQSQVRTGLESRWVDVYETDGKQSGAYSGGTYDTQPFILMNYQDDIASMYTLAHELGHSMHSELTKAAQPYVYSGYEIFVAEVASTVNECLLTEHLLETVEDPAFRKQVLTEFLERVRSTLYRQTLFAEFEHRTHELEEDGEALTADRLDACYRELKAAYYEPAELDDHIAREWMRIPHFYRAFYVYQYATGISAALAITDRILDRGQDAATDYRSFLERGSREYPIDLLQIAGVDMRTSAPIERALATYGDRIDEMANLMA